MTEKESGNVAILDRAYRRWADTLGGSVQEWLEICDEKILFGSLAEGMTGADYLTDYRGREELKQYFAGLERDWQMLEFAAEHFVAQDDRVVMLGRCAFRHKRTGKVVWTRKADTWRFTGGKAIEFYEFYDTAQVAAAVN